MLVLDKDTPDEVALRLVLESDEHGREYFDHYDTLLEMFQGLGNIVRNTDNSVERMIGIAVVPKSEYGNHNGYGFECDELERTEALTFRVSPAMLGAINLVLLNVGEALTHSTQTLDNLQRMLGSRPELFRHLDCNPEALETEVTALVEKYGKHCKLMNFVVMKLIS